MTDPVMLYLVPHETHRDMAEQIGAELIEAETGGVLDRAKSALSRDLSGRTVILEGGVPLSEALVMKLAGRADTVVMLAADETLQNQAVRLPYYTGIEWLVHNAALRALDGVIALSPEIKAWAEDRTGAEVALAYPYMDRERFDIVSSVEPDYEADRGLYIGADRPSNNVGMLGEAADRAGVEIDVVGKGTGDRDDTGQVAHHGYVSDDELLDLMNGCSFLTFPATAGAHPMVTVEAMAAGLAPITTYGVGTASHVQKVHPMLLHDPDVDSLAVSLKWWEALGPGERSEISDRAREVGSKFDPDTGREAFRLAYSNVLTKVKP